MNRFVTSLSILISIIGRIKIKDLNTVPNDYSIENTQSKYAHLQNLLQGNDFTENLSDFIVDIDGQMIDFGSWWSEKFAKDFADYLSSEQQRFAVELVRLKTKSELKKSLERDTRKATSSRRKPLQADDGERDVPYFLRKSPAPARSDSINCEVRVVHDSRPFPFFALIPSQRTS